MKTVEELKSLRGEIETLNKKLAELTEEELAQVSGGTHNIRKEIDGASDPINDNAIPRCGNGPVREPPVYPDTINYY